MHACSRYHILSISPQLTFCLGCTYDVQCHCAHQRLFGYILLLLLLVLCIAATYYYVVHCCHFLLVLYITNAIVCLCCLLPPTFISNVHCQCYCYYCSYCMLLPLSVPLLFIYTVHCYCRLRFLYVDVAIVYSVC